MRGFLIYPIVVILLNSCSYFNQKTLENGVEEDPIVKAYDSYLYPSDISVLNFNGLSKEDSSSLVQKFISDWVQHQVIVSKAESEGSIDIDRIELKAEELKYQLIRHEFEKSLVVSSLDTLITNEEIEKYYEEHKADFELKQNIVKCLFVKLHNNTPKIASFKRAFFKTKVDIDYIRDYCSENADVFSLNDSSWVLFDDVVFGSPYAKISEQINFIQNTTTTMKKDKDYRFYLRIIDYRLVNSTSPVEFHLKGIANVIYNQRKLELIKNVEKKLYKDALNEQEIEFYNQ